MAHLWLFAEAQQRVADEDFFAVFADYGAQIRRRGGHSLRDGLRKFHVLRRKRGNRLAHAAHPAYLVKPANVALLERPYEELHIHRLAYQMTETSI